MKLTYLLTLEIDGKIQELEEAVAEYRKAMKRGGRKDRREDALRHLRSKSRNLAYKLHTVEKLVNL